MPKLYNAKKLDKGLKIGLRDLNGTEWFADMTLDADKRTCRKINVPFLPEDKGNILLAENKAKKLFEKLLQERLNETNQKRTLKEIKKIEKEGISNYLNGSDGDPYPETLY